ncbi:MAG: primosomal protein N', partial [Hyphomicrobiaceae bacterium]|nr:primosomal protein N' [Hyphomicrobiaceae bacterium]
MNKLQNSTEKLKPCDAKAKQQYVSVVLPFAIDRSYDYLVGEIGTVAPGTFVLVPLGTQIRTAVVWDSPVGIQKPVQSAKLKQIAGKIDIPRLPIISMRFAEWISQYTLSPIGMIVRMTIGASSAAGSRKQNFGVQYVLGAPQLSRMTPARIRVVEVSADGQIRTKADLAKTAGCTTAVVEGLIKAGILTNVVIPEKAYAQPNPAYKLTDFNEDQKIAVHLLKAAVEAQAFSVSLLDGVTGAGKTEVYFEAVASALAARHQVLILLPEIALTSQFLNRFEKRFGCVPVEWHSATKETERERIWRAVAQGAIQCVVGARSALFLPYKNLGLIIVDEEHDSGFKQEDRVNYQARDMAVVRANLGKFPIILASATPSIESHVNARTGRYRHVILPGRYSGINLPDITPIDLKSNPPKQGCWLSPILINALKETLNDGRQSLLFLNRRGYAPLTLCRTCGYRIKCPQCSAWMVEHRFRQRLTCHHCGFTLPILKECPECGEKNCLVLCGPGVERILEEIT